MVGVRTGWDGAGGAEKVGDEAVSEAARKIDPTEARRRSRPLPIDEVRVDHADVDDEGVRARVVRALADVLSGRVG